jgi:hypothetical protein
MLRSPGRDNHWLDCVVGCAVGASMLGAMLREAEAGCSLVWRATVILAPWIEAQEQLSASATR